MCLLKVTASSQLPRRREQDLGLTSLYLASNKTSRKTLTIPLHRITFLAPRKLYIVFLRRARLVCHCRLRILLRRKVIPDLLHVSRSTLHRRLRRTRTTLLHQAVVETRLQASTKFLRNRVLGRFYKTSPRRRCKPSVKTWYETNKKPGWALKINLPQRSTLR